MSRWDDFAWTHYQVGFIAHDAACFLSWHRWFIALFESSLRTDCGYSGPMPYWDWTLDWEHPELASIFDDKFGLGGNGDKMHTSTADGAWCVESGPFAGAQIPFDYSAVAGEEVFLNAQGQNTSFCLSRKFALGNSFDASQLAPQHVSWVLSQRGYVKFLMELEEGPHNTIPFGINGTFLTLYAPEDPIFFLHHMQLDRLWWSWQKSRPENARAYNGPSTSQTTAVAKLTDSLPFGNLSEDVIVKDIIDTKRGRLCYEYDEVAA
ncbi:Di-copper centre-containing [Lecanosticta acicola]|uniref:Di-copper centre-containing n=1 Tax=Lecanosticta acicola TaxID=111012 RepID=A0AAI8YWT9_9PEZI|nr:Di-copper centre-containing [Lecanosticta acicola]